MLEESQRFVWLGMVFLLRCENTRTSDAFVDIPDVFSGCIYP